jgi:uncharacterized protein YodC (DUF2158 family)
MFEAGDTVQLKSGGPMMTVEHAGNYADGVFRVLCTWFDSAGKFQRKAFPPETLKAATSSSCSST